MRVRNVSMLAAAVAAVGLSVAASATTLDFGGYAGPILVKYGNFDVGRIYGVAPGSNTTGVSTLNGLNQTDAASPFVPVASGGSNAVTGSTNAAEDTWGIAQVTDIYAGATTLSPHIYSAGNPLFQGNIQLTALFFGGQDNQVKLSADGVTETIRSQGVSVGFFASVLGNNSDGVDLSATPSAGARGNSPISYAGITDGTLILSFVGQTGHFADNLSAEQESNINLGVVNGASNTTSVGDGKLFLQKSAINLGSGLVTGVENFVLANGTGGQADAQVDFTTAGSAGTDWTVTSNDPLRGAASGVPTPSAAGGALLLAAIGAMNIYRRRRANR